MAQPGNDWAREGVQTDYPDNSHSGIVAHPYTNATPLSMKTKEDGDEADRGQSADAGKWGRWLYGDKPGIE